MKMNINNVLGTVKCLIEYIRLLQFVEEGNFLIAQVFFKCNLSIPSSGRRLRSIYLFNFTCKLFSKCGLSEYWICDCC